jgi:hypothetical protein
VASWHDRRKARRSRLREQVVDLLPLVIVLVGVILFLAFWGPQR